MRDLDRKPRSRLRSVVAGLCVGGALVALWPAFSERWVGLLRALGEALTSSSVRVVVPATASPAIPVVAAIIAALSLPIRRRILLATGLITTTLGTELLIVMLGSLAHLPAKAVNFLVAVPVGVPFVWLLLGVLMAERAADGMRSRQ